jgi:CBS domain-containing protein
MALLSQSNRKHSARGSAVKLHDSVERILRQKGSEVYSISPDATVYEALEILEERNIGALLVLAGDQLVGLLSERDYVRKVKLKGHSSTDLKVEEIMSSPVVTVDPKTTVDECMRSMTNKRCRHLPVIDEGKVVGVVSIGDLVNWIMTVQDVTIHQLEDYICGKYPA